MFTKLGHLSLEPKSMPPPKRMGWIGRGKGHHRSKIDIIGLTLLFSIGRSPEHPNL